MSKVIFSLTDRQADVLRRMYAGASLAWRENETIAGLVRRGLATGDDYTEPRLTPLGEAAAALAVALAPEQRTEHD